jgi:plasmid maintenance system antidote protein VapI
MKIEKLFNQLVEEGFPKIKTTKILDINNDPHKQTIHLVDGQMTDEDLLLPPNTLIGKGGVIALPNIEFSLPTIMAIANLLLSKSKNKSISIEVGHFLRKELFGHEVKFDSNNYCIEVLGVTEEEIKQIAESISQLTEPGIVMLRNYFDGEIVFIKNLNP